MATNSSNDSVARSVGRNVRDVLLALFAFIFLLAALLTMTVRHVTRTETITQAVSTVVNDFDINELLRPILPSEGGEDVGLAELLTKLVGDKMQNSVTPEQMEEILDKGTVKEFLNGKLGDAVEALLSGESVELFSKDELKKLFREAESDLKAVLGSEWEWDYSKIDEVLDEMDFGEMKINISGEGGEQIRQVIELARSAVLAAAIVLFVLAGIFVLLLLLLNLKRFHRGMIAVGIAAFFAGLIPVTAFGLVDWVGMLMTELPGASFAKPFVKAMNLPGLASWISLFAGLALLIGGIVLFAVRRNAAAKAEASVPAVSAPDGEGQVQ